MSFVLLLSGLLLLAVSGDALVRGSTTAAERMHISPVIIGLTIVAFGTSAPELVISIEAALAGAPGLAIGNAVGSNIANSLLVLGLPAIIAPILLNGSGIRRAASFMLVISFGVLLFARDGQISRIEGLALFTLLIVYLTYSGLVASGERKNGRAKKAAEDAEMQSTEIHEKPQGQIEPHTKGGMPNWLIISLITIGIMGLGVGGKLTTEGALGIARQFGIGETTIGLTIVALGTSLPELTATLIAALRRQTGVVIGNVIGSNIFNLLGIVGITSMLVPLDVSTSILDVHIWVMLAATIAIIPIAFSTRRVNRWEGLGMTAAYLIYIGYIFTTGA